MTKAIGVHVTEQTLRGGSHSTNIQIIQTGPTIAETRDLVVDIVRAEVAQYQREAEAEVERRLQIMADAVIKMVAGKGESAAAAFADPDIQYTTAVVGREFARTGDEDLGEVLVGLLGDRIDAEPRTLLAVVLNDAIRTAAGLTDRELDALALVWRMTRTRWNGMKNLDAYRQYVLDNVVPFELPEGTGSYYHLDSVGCGTAGLLGPARIGEAFLNTYPGIFTKGFTANDVIADLVPHLGNDSLFAPCLRDATRIQVKAIDDEAIDGIAATAGIPAAAGSLKALAKQNLMTIAEVEEELASFHPGLQITIDRWAAASAGTFNLSAVGVAIAHAQNRRLTGMDSALSIWIS